MIIEPLYKLTKDCKNSAEVIKVLLDKDLISYTSLRNLEIYYEYKRNLNDCGGKKLTAVFDTAIKKNVSDRTVYRVREKFEE